MKGFSQLCVWPGTIVGQDEIQNFENWFKEEFDCTVKYAEEVLTLPDPGDTSGETGGRNDLFFYIKDEDITKFAIQRFKVSIRWWEDVLGNGHGEIYPEHILEKYPKTW